MRYNKTSRGYRYIDREEYDSALWFMRQTEYPYTRPGLRAHWSFVVMRYTQQVIDGENEL